MKKTIILLVMITLVFTLVGCKKKEKEPLKVIERVAPEEKTFTGKYVVDANYVKRNLNKITLVDARGEDNAKRGTIEGSVVTSWQYLAACETGSPGDPMWGTILPTDEVSEALSNLGLSKDEEIVLFSDAQGGWGEDGRILWQLRTYGYTDVKMVDGGYQALVKGELPLTTDIGEPTPDSVIIGGIDTRYLIETAALQTNYADYKVVDTRSEEEYNGATLYGEAKGGHLPGAINIPFSKLFGTNGRLKPVEDLTAMFKAAGLEEGNLIVTYCTGGIRSAYMQVVLEMCGFGNALNYDESYYRWAAINEVE